MTIEKEDPRCRTKSRFISFLLCVSGSVCIWLASLIWHFDIEASRTRLRSLLAIYSLSQIAVAYAFWIWRHPRAFLSGAIFAFFSILGGLVTAYGILALFFSLLVDSS